MRVRGLTLLAILCLLMAGRVSAETVAQRIISLAPHATELAFAAGMGDQVIGVSAWSNYPPEAQQREQVASWQGINLERVLALKPDLVLAWREGNPQRPLEQLSAFGIPVVYLDPTSLEAIPTILEQLGQYSAHPEVARQNAQDLRQQLADLKTRYAHAPKHQVFLQFGTHPLFTSGKQSLQNQVLALCGGVNVFDDSKVPWPQVSREQVLRRNPQVIIITGTAADAAATRDFWSPQLSVPIITVDEDWFNRSSPRMLLAAQYICQQLAALPAQ
ncbi:vitamin B12 ABC transporter substrate-binding protein BtuF [Symbiopectobacterium purcellii]|uniref:Vitamin B12-binding protein n=1 Tax=Symbiopectobacterium purcellii TaxID=2871826 RepID=A0ABX9AHS5_9ENTR|nr:vitamin B12 ABC transporter substrate-binding protein BtuF [Symbiopectobacterium purcellii]QZN94705.1 vitamin B12 ABC transporter substrate-binding protein BtuF [Symbiopectobacterium purcellii]